MSAVEQILDYMEKHPVAWRGRPLAQAMYGKDVSAAETARLMALLKYLSDQKRLVRCEVQIPGERAQFEYRISAAGAHAKGDLHNFQISRRPASARALPLVRSENVGGGGDAILKKVVMRPGRKPRKVKSVEPLKAPCKTAPKGARKKRAAPAPPAAAARWALASDGAFILLGADVEIPRPAAQALVEFVRRLDAGSA